MSSVSSRKDQSRKDQSGALNPHHDRRWWVLLVVVFGLIVVILDTTVLNVALKTIADPRRGLGATQTQLEWVLNSYTLVFAGLLITFGALGDRIGHKRILIAGMVIFTAGSLISAYASDAGQLIAGRTVMGIGGAAVIPATLAVISHVFEPAERAKAIGVWGASVGLGAAVGPIVGGTLIEHFWWGSVFLINVLIAAVVVPAMVILVPDSRNPDPARLDPVGALLSLAGLAALVYGIVHGGDQGSWGRPSVSAPLLAGLLLLVGFGVWEASSAHPAIDLTLFRTPRFAASVSTVLLIFFTATGGLFFGAFYLQSVHGESPLMAGVWMLPFAAAQLIFAPRSAGLVRRFGARAGCLGGTLLVAASFVPFIWFTAGTPMWLFGVTFFVEGAGIAHVVSPTAEVVMSSVPRAKAGSASAVSNTFRQVGGALGVAITGTVLTRYYREGLTPQLNAVPGLDPAGRATLSRSITATSGYVEQHAAAHPQLTTLLAPASDSFIHAMHIASGCCAAVAGLAAVIVLVWMPRPTR